MAIEAMKITSKRHHRDRYNIMEVGDGMTKAVTTGQKAWKSFTEEVIKEISETRYIQIKGGKHLQSNGIVENCDTIRTQ